MFDAVTCIDLVHGMACMPQLPHSLLAKLLPNFGALLGGPMASRHANLPDYRIDIAIGQPESIPDHAGLVDKQIVPGEGMAAMAANDGKTWFVFDREISLVLEHSRRQARIVVHPGCEFRVAGSAIMLAMEDAIDSTGQFILHAALLRLPDRESNVMLYAPSGTGKTTSTLSLLPQGYGFCSDDASVLKIMDGMVTGWGFPRFLKVHCHTLSMLPWLAPLMTDRWDAAGEQILERDVLNEKYPVVDRDARQIHCLFSLMRTDDAHCSIEAISPMEAALELTADNVRVGRLGLLPVQERRFDQLLQMVSLVPAFRLYVGNRCVNLGAEIHAAIQRALIPG